MQLVRARRDEAPAYACYSPRVARPITHRYLDPLDTLWLGVASRVGFVVRRSPDVFASTDGRGTMTIGSPETLDPDDCLAQMIFHELCHSLTEGRGALGRADFGLDNESARDVIREHACLRLQAKLAGDVGLRSVLGPTTDFRAYYDTLPDDPMADSEDPAVVIARLALGRVDEAPWGPHLRAGLVATAAVLEALGTFVSDAEASGALPLLLGAGDFAIRARGRRGS